MAFKIKVDGLTICNSKNQDSLVLNPQVVLEANAPGEFSFTFPPEHKYIDSIKRRKSIVAVYRDDELVFRGVCIKETTDFWGQKKIECEGELTYLNDSIQRQARYTDMTVYTYLKTLLELHNEQVDDFKKFQIGTVTGGSSTTSLYRYTNMNSTMKEIAEDLVDNYGGYIRCRYKDGVNYIDYINRAPRVASQTIQLGVNLLDYESNIDNTDICTRIIPLGAQLDTEEVEGLEAYLTIKDVNDGLDYIQSDAADTYGIISKVVRWDSVTTANALYSKAESYLSDEQFEDVVISCKALDLGYLSNSVSKFQLLDSVRIISEYHGLDAYFTLTEMKLNLAEPEKDILTFGKTDKISLSVRTSTTNTELLNRINRIPTKNNILTDALAQAKSQIAGAEGGYVVIDEDKDTGLPWRILIMDTDDINTAQHIIQLNKEGIGFSKSGINGEFTSAWTIDGEFDAQWITAGVLQGIEIIAEKGTVGGWTITDGNLYSDLNIEGTLYRAFMQNPSSTTDWVYSIQSSTNGGASFNPIVYIRADGRIYTKDTLTVGGNSSVAGNSSIGGTLYIGGTLTALGDAYIGGTLTAHGDAYLKGKSYIEGHKSYVNPNGGSGVLPLPDYIRACVNNEY